MTRIWVPFGQSSCWTVSRLLHIMPWSASITHSSIINPVLRGPLAAILLILNLVKKAVCSKQLEFLPEKQKF
jgi:hypothetical protein